MPVERRFRLLYVAIAGVVLICDQWTKAMVESAVLPDEFIPVIPHFFNLTNTRNPGAAFGLLSDSPAAWKTALLIVVSLLLLLAVLVFVLKSRRLGRSTGVAMGLILGGAASNLLDRFRYGQVTDFLDFYVGQYHWYTFNLADSAIVIGAGLLILGLLVTE
ncbi:MAG: signal peptidase II [Terriglobia bacterium]